MLYSILMWVLFGLVAGAIAKFIMPGNQSMGWLTTSILGIVGAIVGGYLVTAILGIRPASEGDWFHIQPMISAVLGSLLVLWIYGMLTNRRG